MVELWIFDRDDKGHEQKHVWQFSPTLDESGWDILRNERARATGAEVRKPFSIKEIRFLTVGAGTLRNPLHNENFHRMLLAHRIVWKRFDKNNEPIYIDFTLVIDEEVRYEFLEDRRSLKKKTVKLIETKPVYYTSFESFLKERIIDTQS